MPANSLILCCLSGHWLLTGEWQPDSWAASFFIAGCRPKAGPLPTNCYRHTHIIGCESSVCVCMCESVVTLHFLLKVVTSVYLHSELQKVVFFGTLSENICIYAWVSFNLNKCNKKQREGPFCQKSFPSTLVLMPVLIRSFICVCQLIVMGPCCCAEAFSIDKQTVKLMLFMPDPSS